MAFGSEAARWDAVFGTNVGQFRAEMGEVGGVYERTTGQMSNESLRAAVAHEKLTRAIKRGGPESLSAKNATLAYRREMDALASTSNRTSGALQHEQRELERLTLGSVRGAGGLSRLRGAGVFLSTSFLGGYGLGYALRKVVDASSALQEETEKTGVVFGQSAAQVQAWAKTLALSFGVSEEEALKAAGVFGNMLRPLHFGEQAAASMSQRLVELAADMASFNNTKPDVVLQALSSGLAGQVRPLRQYGVFLSQARIETEAYSAGIAKAGQKLTQQQKVQAAYNIILKDTKLQQGDVARNTGSLSVAQSKLNAELQQSEATIGRDLRPELAHLANAAAVYLDKLNSTGRLQHDVNAVFHEGEQIAHGLRDGYREIHTVLGPLVDALGGTQRTAKLVVEAFALYKLIKIASAIRGIGAAATVSAGEVNALAVAEGRAASAGLGLGVLGRGGAGRVVGLEPLPGGLLGGALFGGALALASRGEAGKVIGGPLDISVSPGAGDGVGYKDPVTGKYHLIRVDPNKPLDPQILADIRRRHPGYAAATVAGSDTSDRQPGGSPGGPGAPAPATKNSSAGAGGSGRLGLIAQFARAELAVARSRANGDARAERQWLVEEQRILKQEISSSKKAFRDKTALYDQLSTINGQIQSIDDAAQAKRDAAQAKLDVAAAKTAAARKRAAAARKRAHDHLVAAAKREAAERSKQRAAQIELLTHEPVEDQIAIQKAIGAGASDQALLKLYRKELHDQDLNIAVLRKLGLGDKALLAALTTRNATKKKIADLKKKTKSANPESLFEQAAENARVYGSNIGPAGSILSPQDARGELGMRIVRALERIEGHTKSTAGHTSQIPGKGRVIESAGALAGAGL